MHSALAPVTTLLSFGFALFLLKHLLADVARPLIRARIHA